MFQAIHVGHNPTNKEDLILDWAGQQGLDKAKFEQLYNSFGIDTKVQRGVAMGRAYGVQFTPAIAVEGKYWTGPSMVLNANGGADLPRFFQVVDQLIGMERGKHAAAAGGTGNKKKG